MSAVDWKLIDAGCPQCGAKAGGRQGVHWNALSVWCLRCDWGKNWARERRAP